MRHGRGTYFAGFNLLFEIIHRYIRPHIAVEVQHYVVDAFQGIEISRHHVVMFYLSRRLQAF